MSDVLCNLWLVLPLYNIIRLTPHPFAQKSENLGKIVEISSENEYKPVKTYICEIVLYVKYNSAVRVPLKRDKLRELRPKGVP